MASRSSEESLKVCPIHLSEFYGWRLWKSSELGQGDHAGELHKILVKLCDTISHLRQLKFPQMASLGSGKRMALAKLSSIFSSSQPHAPESVRPMSQHVDHYRTKKYGELQTMPATFH
ncbi:hypothetical protein CRG98_019836 [Punica granatum]|uniref:Uncharacterized protein n=1 Tax=Punica granatum TaxID=22663 RepID=A0A2I0JU31_PUNGR|nr:hypothetical protein CRG98_019836 [Punica granatum]